jgi:hypothetical protein
VLPQPLLEILDEGMVKKMFFNLGPHRTRLRPEDVELLHNLYLKLTSMGLGHKLHRPDVGCVALRHLESVSGSESANEVLDEMLQKASEDKIRGMEPSQNLAVQ